MSRALTAKRIVGPVVSGDRQLMWFILAPQRWSFRSKSEREALIRAQAGAFARLVGRRVHIRVTSRPYAVEQWARQLDDATPDPLPYWPEHLRTTQLHLLGMTLSDKLVFLGVELDKSLRSSAREAHVRELEAIIGVDGLEGRAATPGELEYLMQRSVALCAPAPVLRPQEVDVWDVEDIAGLADTVDWSAKPFDRSVRIIADVNGREHQRHVVTLTLGRMQTLQIPEAMEPWVAMSDRLFPVEWSIIADVITPGRVKRQMRDVMQRAQSQIEHYAEHGLPSPMELARMVRVALAVEEDVDKPDRLEQRCECWVRAAVSGASEQEAIDRATRLQKLYDGTGLGFERGSAQFMRAREFIPGEPLSDTAHRRRMPVTTLAAAVPCSTALIGDRVGHLIGHTAGTSLRAVFWDPFRNMEVREGSGLTLVAGTLGAGKSVFIGSIIYQVVMSGVDAIVLDPSGPLGEITKLPELRDVSRTVDLMNAQPGELGPYRVIRDPRPEQHLAPREDGMSNEAWRAACAELWQRAMILSAARRKMLCQDVLLTMLPATIARKAETLHEIHRAVKQVGGGVDRTARDVLDQLLRNGGHAAAIGSMLEDLAELPQAQLIFPASGEQSREIDETNWALQIFTMRGNVLPDRKTAREDWSIEERIGVPLLLLASRLTVDHVYSRPRHERKFVALDEAHAFTIVPSGRTLISGLGRDTRKHNIRAVVGSQNPEDMLQANIANLVDNVFAGHTIDGDAQSALLRLMHVPLGVGYEQVLGSLRPVDRAADRRLGYRKMVWADGMGGIETINLHWPERLRQVGDTTANPQLSAGAARRELIGS